MYCKCPKCGYKRHAHDEGDLDVCPACGLIFSKWMKKQFNNPDTFSGEYSGYSSSKQNFIKHFIAPLLYVGNLTGQSRFYGYLLIYLCFFVWGWSFILTDLKSQELNASFMHTINLVFHEAGHVILRLLVIL